MNHRSLWTASDAERATQGVCLGAKEWRAHGVSIDSRTVEAGDVFVALVGPNQNGHAYVASALEKGAAAALVSDVPEGLAAEAPLLKVADTLEGLNALGVAARERSDAQCIAVTGSVGKTGVKEMLRHVLSAQAPTHASVKSYNNLWGVPLTLARMPQDTTYGVFEIGMNHAGEITPLTQLVQPDVAMITTVAPVHLEFFDSVDGIADAKAEIFDGLKPGGTAIIHADIPQTARLVTAAQRVRDVTVLTFGNDPHARVRLLDMTCDADGSDAHVDVDGVALSYRVSLPGAHLVMNSLAVLAAVQAVGADINRAADAMATLTPIDGRGVRHRVAGPRGTFTVIDESYNANPVSMAAALRTLDAAPVNGHGRRIAVLGDMLELGPDADQLHADMVAVLNESNIHQVFLSGPHMQHLWARLPEPMRGAYGATSLDLEQTLADTIAEGDVVMVKGSLGSKMGPLVAMLTALSQGLKEGEA